MPNGLTYLAYSNSYAPKIVCEYIIALNIIYMNTILQCALKAINQKIQEATGLSHMNINHPDDRNAATEMFVRLHQHGVRLVSNEIEEWARYNGWQWQDASELGALAWEISSNEKVSIEGGPWWDEGIIETFSSNLAVSNAAVEFDSLYSERLLSAGL